MIVVRDWNTEYRFPTGAGFRTVPDGEYRTTLEVLDDEGVVMAAFATWSSVSREDATMTTVQAFDAYVDAETRADLLSVEAPSP